MFEAGTLVKGHPSHGRARSRGRLLDLQEVRDLAPRGLGGLEVDLGALDKTWAVNLRAPLLWVRAAYSAWMEKSGGSVVNVSSVGGLRPSPITGAYNVSKAGLVHMTQQLALELAPRIRVNAVAPAVVKTRLSEMLWQDEAVAARMHPLGRLGTPEDISRAIVFLASDAADWMTGVILPVDGGMTGASSSGIA